MDDQQETEARLQALESLVRQALGGGSGSLGGDVTGPVSTNLLSSITSLAGSGNTFVGVNNAGQVTPAPIQRGTSAIVAPGNGFVDIPANITAISRIFVTIKDFNPSGAATVEFDTPAANRVIGAPGSFRVRAAITGTGATAVGDLSTFDWLIID